MPLTLAYVLIGICLAVAIGAGIIAIISYRKMNQDRVTVKGSGRRNHLYFFYKLFTSVPLLKRYFNKFRARLATLYPADFIDINRKATGMMLRSSLLAIACMVVLIIICKGDFFYVLISMATVYIIFTNSVTRAVDKLELTLLKQFAGFITDCRSNYHTVGMVDDAIFMTLDSNPYEVNLHVNRIYEIIISTHISEEVEKYTDIAPNRFLEMFAAICATIQEYGDKKLENGESLFLKNLEYLKSEVYVEINKREKNNYLFSGLIFTTVCPIFSLKLIARWAQSIEELSDFYDGAAGMVVMALVFVSSFICYELISNLRDGRVQSEKEHKYLEKLAGLAGIRKLLTAHINRNYTKALRIGNNLKMVGDHISPQAYLLERIIIGIALGIFTTTIVFYAHFLNKSEILHNFSESFTESIVPSEEYRETMKEIGEAYLLSHKKIGLEQQDIDELSQEIVQNESMDPLLADEIAKEVVTRAGRYQKAYFKWYYLLIILATVVIGFYAPIWLLMYQMSIMKLSMEDEVAQFQTLALILMNVDGMTLDVILEWMERFAFCFRQSISECILNLESSSQKAIEKMKDSESFPPFLRFCENLLNIDNVGVASAFDEVKTEQENYKEQRALNVEISMNKKSNIGKDISYIPAAITVAGYLIFPFVWMAFRMLQSMGDALSY